MGIPVPKRAIRREKSFWGFAVRSGVFAQTFFFKEKTLIFCSSGANIAVPRSERGSAYVGT